MVLEVARVKSAEPKTSKRTTDEERQCVEFRGLLVLEVVKRQEEAREEKKEGRILSERTLNTGGGPPCARSDSVLRLVFTLIQNESQIQLESR